MAWQLSAYDSVKRMGDEYARLSIYFHKLVEWARLTKQNIPHDVINRYHLRVLAYRNFANEVFKELDRQKITIDQVVFRDGKPAQDKSGGLITKRISGPLFPPSFVVEKDAQGVARVSGTLPSYAPGQVAVMGALPLAVYAGYVLVTAVGGFILAKSVGPMAIDALRQIVFLFRGPIFTPQEISDARVDCLDKIKRDFPNLPPEAQAEAIKNCSGLKGQGVEGVSWTLVFGIAAIGGAVIYFKSKQAG